MEVSESHRVPLVFDLNYQTDPQGWENLHPFSLFSLDHQRCGKHGSYECMHIQNVIKCRACTILELDHSIKD